jgi:hypothetical protein
LPALNRRVNPRRWAIGGRRQLPCALDRGGDHQGRRRDDIPGGRLVRVQVGGSSLSRPHASGCDRRQCQIPFTRGDVETPWLTETIGFKDDASGGGGVSTDESFEDYRDGALSARRTHEAAFAIDEVAISEGSTDDIA